MRIHELFSLDDLSQGCRVALYGAGGYGVEFLGRIRSERPDIEAVCFLDTFLETGGRVEGLPVVNARDFDFASPVELVITSAGVGPIARGIEARGARRCFVPMKAVRGADWFVNREVFEDPIGTRARAEGHRFWEKVYFWRYTALCDEHFGPPEPNPPLVDRIPDGLLSGFTMDGQCALEYDVQDQRQPPNRVLIYTDAEIDDCLARIERGESTIYGALDGLVHRALEEHPIGGKDVAVFGSTSPWYEAVCLRHGGRPVTVEYQRIISRTQRVRTLTVDELKAAPEEFDHALSISSFEHDGLGAYGDPIDPDADLAAMRQVRGLLRPGGLLFLNVPVAWRDRLIFNGCRVYGRRRLPLLFAGFELVASYGYDPKRMQDSPDTRFEPLFVLRRS
ncbi:MAG: DUF268 domain-containing protein [Desulfovibrionaceae bacterium]|nr:DUF268 domain-containing protein [Desulfovibrionaceae bacterium]